MLKKLKNIHGKKASSVHEFPPRQLSVHKLDQEKVTRISKMIVMEGSMRGGGDLVIEGKMKGDVDLPGGHMVIAKSGSVEAEINVQNVKISGKMKGNIIAPERVDITEGSEFEGEIKTRNISVEDGAYMKAVIEIEKEKISKSNTKKGSNPQDISGSDRSSSGNAIL